MTSDHLPQTLARLDAEWRHLLDTPWPEPLAWRRDCGAFATASDLAGVLPAIAAAPDAALHHLLVAHAGGDALAGRVVLRAVLGKLVRMATVDPLASLDDYLAAAWERIAHYPTATRPTSVAANLVLDTLKAVKREQRRPAIAPPVAPREPDAATILAAATALGLLDDTAAATVRAVYLDGLSGADAAAHLGVSPAAVRVRCHRAVRVLRSHAAELAGLAG